jgi:signal transduction histidine kinase
VYQLVVTLLHPPWISPVTDWLRAALAWPELVLVAWVSRWLTRTRRPEALSWWLLSVALLSYVIARNLWTIYDRFIYPNHVPFPTFPDLFFILQYPFFFLALVLLPGAPSWRPRLKVMLDCLLLMGAASALSWYFILAPIYVQSGESPPGKVVNLAYPLADLCLLFGLTVALIYRPCLVARAVLSLLIVAVLCLVVADSLAASLLLYPSHVYRTGNLPDLFWMAFYLLVPLAGLVLLRLTQRTPTSPQEMRASAPEQQPLQRQDLQEVLQVLSPLVAAVLACAAIAARAIIAQPLPTHPLVPSLMILGLLLLVIVRQGIAVLENAQLRRQWAAAQANEQAVRETNRRLEAFLSIASHELKTPLTTIILSFQLLQRYAQKRAAPTEGAGDQARIRMEIAPGILERTLQQLERLSRLVNDLVDTSRIQAGPLELDRKPADLAAIVREAVEEQRQAFLERTINLHLPADPVPVLAAVDRIGQVVTNYLTNALKYSQEDRPVEAGVQIQEQQAHVWVRDQGPGIPLAEQQHIWERFHRVPGMKVQSGSGIGLGLGLHISKTIIEQHGGQVGVQSMPGQGSTFWFTLPLAIPEEQA